MFRCRWLPCGAWQLDLADLTNGEWIEFAED
jgi:hypothetical protein